MKKWKMNYLKSIKTSFIVIVCMGILFGGCGTDSRFQNSQEKIEDFDTQMEIFNESESLEEIETECEANIEESEKKEFSCEELYEQFLSNEVMAIVADSCDGYYINSTLQKGGSYNLTELAACVSDAFLKDSYSGKRNCDFIEYAYVKNLDQWDIDTKSLLVRFGGLDIYEAGDDSYAAFVIIENQGQLYLTNVCECWARNQITIYDNGVLSGYSDGGAAFYSKNTDVILSDRGIEEIIQTDFIKEWEIERLWTDVYEEAFGSGTVQSFIVSVSKIGEEQYYQYDLANCMEEERNLCEVFINRCQDEKGIYWATKDEIEQAVKERCVSIGVDFEKIEQSKEIVWNKI